jgi:ketosteroid isomerase-like protein
MSAPGHEVIARFYAAFGKRDAEAMAACYADDVVFSDPVFPHLQGEEARDMWRMLCARGKDLVVEASAITDTSAHWDATYTFAQTGRKVVNRIDARFVVHDGRIARHSDSFDFYKWTRMALGFPGLVLGWTPLLQGKVRGQAALGLRKFREKKPA